MLAPVAVIINSAAGGGAKARVTARVAELFESHGVEADILAVEKGDDLSATVHRAVRGGYPTIVAGGGAGTMIVVAAALVGTDRVMGVLPLGTLNHFAKDLGIPLDLDGAIGTLFEGQVVRVDVGEVNGLVFVNNSSLGLYPKIVRHRMLQQAVMKRGKWFAFLWGVVTVFRRYPFLGVRLSMEDQELIRLTPFVFIGNNEYKLEGLNLGARANLCAGQLCLYMAHRAGRLGLLRFVLRALLERLREEADFDALCTREVVIQTRRRRLHVAIDGEVVLLTTPLHYRVRPAALQVTVPWTAQEQETDRPQARQ